MILLMQAEVDFLGQLHHPNLVKLIGYCIEDDQRLLVYEFMTRGSLENHLFRSESHCLPNFGHSNSVSFFFLSPIWYFKLKSSVEVVLMDCYSVSLQYTFLLIGL